MSSTPLGVLWGGKRGYLSKKKKTMQKSPRKKRGIRREEAVFAASWVSFSGERASEKKRKEIRHETKNGKPQGRKE